MQNKIIIIFILFIAPHTLFAQTGCDTSRRISCPDGAPKYFYNYVQQYNKNTMPLYNKKNLIPISVGICNASEVYLNGNKTNLGLYISISIKKSGK